MSLEAILANLSEESPFRLLLPELASDDQQRRTKAFDQASSLTHVTSWEEARKPSWSVSEAEAFALLQAIAECDFPPPPQGYFWKDGLQTLITTLWRSPYPSLVGAIGKAYLRMTSDSRRCALLALLGIIGTREAAAVFIACIRLNGWPQDVMPRVYEGLYRLMPYADLLMPDVLLLAGNVAIGVGDVIARAISNSMVKIDVIGDHLETLAPYTIKMLKEALKSAAKYQNKHGIAWRFDKDYHQWRHQTCMLLDLAGHLRAPKLTPLLQQAAGYADPRIITFAALSLLRRNEAVDASHLETAATCHETRMILRRGLCQLNREDLYPEVWWTWEAIAAADMVEWLCFPTELMREPDELELGGIGWLDDQHQEAVYLWKFRTNDDPWLAGVSGPYPITTDPQLAAANLTFSSFIEWESTTLEEHLQKCVGYVEAIAGQSQ